MDNLKGSRFDSFERPRSLSAGLVRKGPVPDTSNKVEIDVSDPDTIATSTYKLINRPTYVPKKKEQSEKLKQILKPRITVRRRYFSDGTGVTVKNERDLFKERSPFVYPKDLEKFAHKVMTKAWRNEQKVKELQKKISEKTSYASRQQKDLLKRLYVQEPRIKTMKTILDLDPQFFKVIEGRPIPDTLDVKSYVQTVREVLKTRIINGYREDDILLLEEKLILEQKMIDEIRINYQAYVNAFEEFLYNDHTYSMKLLRQSETEATLAYDKYEEYKELSKEYAALRSILYNSEEKWRNCKMYQKFLYLMSPLSWRKENPLTHFGTEDSDEETADDTASIFGKYRLANAEEGGSLEDLIGQFLDESVTITEPALYFKHPDELLQVFRFMEMQNLNSLLHSEELAGPLEQVKEGLINAEAAFNSEIANLQETIEKLEKGISWEEERTTYLEKIARNLVSGEFKKLTVDEDILNLHVFVEDVYETCVGPNDANLTMGDMMKGIEEKYRKELLKLDKMPSEQVTKLESSFYAEEARSMKLAEKAARELLELERLTHKMFGAYAPPYQRTQKEIKWRSPPKNPPRPIPPPPRAWSEEELEYLDFFTKFCPKVDDPDVYEQYLQEQIDEVVKLKKVPPKIKLQKPPDREKQSEHEISNTEENK